ncbi:MAG TPA: zinc ribbon domain-containing protein [Anaerolineaceae bacterium]
MTSFDPRRQRVFHGNIRAAAAADQLAARFNDRQHRVRIEHQGETALVQVGSQHGTPVTVHLADTAGGVMVTMSRDRNWLDKTADASQMIERAATNPISLLAMIPDVLGEFKSENLPPLLWSALDDIFAMARALAGERNAPRNPTVCLYCGTSNPPEEERCLACGAALPVVLPRVCPKCGRGHTSDALFCQACGTRLVNE